MPPVLSRETLPLPSSVIRGSSFEMAAAEPPEEVFLTVPLLIVRLASPTRSPPSKFRNRRLKHFPYWLQRAGLSLWHQNSGESHLSVSQGAGRRQRWILICWMCVW